MASNTDQAGSRSALRVVTFNVRHDTQSDGSNRWENRRSRVADLLRSLSPDLVGLQELCRHQLDFLLEALPGYSSVGVGRDDGQSAGEFCPVLYRSDRFASLEGGTFWLSETPDTPGSSAWASSHCRICSWVRLSDRRTYQGLFVLNTHLDHVSQEARERSWAVLAERIQERISPLPVILMGDFNAPPDNLAIRQITAPESPTPVDALALHGDAGSPKGTFHGFTGKPDDQPIDYIFLSPEWKVAECRVVRDDPRASDHFPLLAVIHS